MSGFGARANFARIRPEHGHHRVTFVELFFDLVFVFAITQISHFLLHDLSPLGVLRASLLLLAIWWAWIDTSWTTNWLDPDRTPVRLMLFALMLVGLVLSTSLPKAFGERGLIFAAAYAVFQLGRSMFMLWAMRRHNPANYRNFQRIFIWQAMAAVLWLAGGLADGETSRLVLWAAALALETAGPSLGFWTPGLGRSTTADWDVEGGHMAERCGLFVIIALGESVLVTGATFAELQWTMPVVGAFAASFAGSVAMWWVYFNIGAEQASHDIVVSNDPGRLARLSYTYIHLLPVAGIIVAAAADELALAHPDGHMPVATAVVLIGGAALYLLGNLLFKWTIYRRPPLSHMAGLAALALLIPVARFLSPAVCSGVVSASLILVALWETRSLGRRVAD